jgi:hypothetical protein
MNVNQFHNLEHAVGTRFIEYVLNYQGKLLRHNQLEGYQFTENQMAGAGQLLSFLVMTFAASPSSALLNYPHLIGEFNRIRQLCGALPQNLTATDDPVLSYLLRRAVECYPILLLKEDERGVPTWGGSGFLRLPGSLADASEVVELLSADPDLRTLLKGEGGAFMMRIEYALDISLRVSSSPLTFCGDFLHGVFAACCYRGKYALCDFLKEVESGLADLRALASGASAQVFYFRGIYGMRLDSSAECHLSDDTTLRNIDDLANPMTQGTMSTGTTEHRNGILLGCVFEHVRKTSRVAFDYKNQSWTNSWFHFEKLADDLVMSVVLGGQHKRAPVGKTFTDIYVPLYRHCPSMRDQVRGGITCLDGEEIGAVGHWFNLLRVVDVDRVRIPLQRIQAALYERDNPLDALLDFFIAWESMFSHKVSTTNSVVRSMEVMLMRAGRAISRNRLSELYKLRSEIVHGSSDENTHSELLTPQAREGVRDEACDVALVVLSELLRDAELLSLEPQQRVMRLLGPTEERCELCRQSRLKFT